MHATDSPALALRTTCCVVGGGPAGMMLGFLLARAGVEVVILEKHADFLRDFRGDTIHPSTLELMFELGILDDFLLRPHQKLRQIGALAEDTEVIVGEFRHLPTQCKFVALMPQWHFLNFLAEKGRAYPQFHLRMETEVVGLTIENGRVAGVRTHTKDGALEINADLVVGADGRHSIVRQEAGLEIIDLGAPIDVLWMSLARHQGDPAQTLGRFNSGRILVTLDRGDYWQCAYIIPKDGFDAIKARGLQAFREEIAAVAPYLSERTSVWKDWSDIKLLSVRVDHLRNWSRAGLLCIGDSAHAMSPVGGVGINLAIQDAVAAANLLWQPLLNGPANHTALDAILPQLQKRREFPTRMTQSFQVFAHKRFIFPALAHKQRLSKLPLPLWLLKTFPILRRIPARMLGVGLRPEHIHSPAQTL